MGDTPFYEWGTGTGDVSGTPFYTWGTGVSNETSGDNRDITVTQPAVGVPAQPVDAGGGPAATYAPQILDIFKYGLGIWNQQQQQTNMLDYSRYEATQLGAFMQGQPAIYATSGGRVIGSANTTIMIVVGIAVLLLMRNK
jgi:hypothetical protein